MADVYLYPAEIGGKNKPLLPGYGCPLVTSKAAPWMGWDAKPLLGDNAFYPDERRRLGFVFLTPEGLEAIRGAKHFYLWEGRIIGEGVVVPQ
jgi:hypothetical protein